MQKVYFKFLLIFILLVLISCSYIYIKARSHEARCKSILAAVYTAQQTSKQINKSYVLSQHTLRLLEELRNSNGKNDIKFYYSIEEMPKDIQKTLIKEFEPYISSEKYRIILIVKDIYNLKDEVWSVDESKDIKKLDL